MNSNSPGYGYTIAFSSFVNVQSGVIDLDYWLYYSIVAPFRLGPRTKLALGQACTRSSSACLCTLNYQLHRLSLGIVCFISAYTLNWTTAFLSEITWFISPLWTISIGGLQICNRPVALLGLAYLPSFKHGHDTHDITTFLPGVLFHQQPPQTTWKNVTGCCVTNRAIKYSRNLLETFRTSR